MDRPGVGAIVLQRIYIPSREGCLVEAHSEPDNLRPDVSTLGPDAMPIRIGDLRESWARFSSCNHHDALYQC